MAKTISVTIPRSAVLELKDDALFGSKLSNAILEAENSGEGQAVMIGKGRKKAVVTITDPNFPD